jgi:hypothetical protein
LQFFPSEFPAQTRRSLISAKDSSSCFQPASPEKMVRLPSNPEKRFARGIAPAPEMHPRLKTQHAA